jgi:tetratricopeptide (TPR) repeat protein
LPSAASPNIVSISCSNCSAGRRGLGLEYELGTVVSNLGVCLTSQGRLDEAAGLHKEAVELCRASGRDEQLVISLFNLGRVSMLQERHGAAAKRFEEALEAARELATGK